MAPTIRIVSLRVGRRKGHPIPDRPTRRDPIPCSTRTLRMQRAAPVLSYHTGQKSRANGEPKRHGKRRHERCGRYGEVRKAPQRHRRPPLSARRSSRRLRTVFCGRKTNIRRIVLRPATGASLHVRPPRIAKKSTRRPSASGGSRMRTDGDKKEDDRRSGRPPGFVRFRRKVLRKRVYDFD